MKAIEIIEIPRDNVNDETVVVTSLYIKENDKVEPGALLADYETSKANFEIHCNFSGYTKLLCKEGDIIEIGKPIIIIADDKNYVHNLDEGKSKNSSKQTFSKKAEEKIEKLGIDKNLFEGIPLVTEKIIDELLENQDVSNTSKHTKKIISPRKSFEIENLTNKNRSGLVSNVEKSFNSITIDTDTIYNQKEFKGSLAIILMEVVSELLTTKKYKHLNSYADGQNIYLYDKVNFGLAMNLGSGLKIGVVNDCDSLKIKEIENRLITLIDKNIDDKLLVDDVTGYSVVLTDLTEQGIDSFTPLITKNNSIMIGLSGQKKGIQKLNIAFDHRVSDGLEIAGFINEIISTMQQKYPNFQNENSCYLCLKSSKEDKELDSPGLIKILAHDNKEKYICRNCFEGL